MRAQGYWKNNMSSQHNYVLSTRNRPLGRFLVPPGKYLSDGEATGAGRRLVSFALGPLITGGRMNVTRRQAKIAPLRARNS